MNGGVPVSVCSICGLAVFPERLLCPRCGSSEWRTIEVREGAVEETTALERAPGGQLTAPVPLGTIRLEGDVVVVARLEPGLGPGASVRLEYRDGVPMARAPDAQ